MSGSASPSGWGKSFAAAWAANKHHAIYVAARSVWTQKAMLGALLRKMGITPMRTICERVDQVADQLRLSARPLILDEFDHLVRKGMVELVRDIYEASHAAILIIGEEQRPAALGRWERFHNRVLTWVPAQPSSLTDARALRALYCQDLAVADDLLQRIVSRSRGAARRICVNLERVRQEAMLEGWEQVDSAIWGKRPLYSGDAPARVGAGR